MSESNNGMTRRGLFKGSAGAAALASFAGAGTGLGLVGAPRPAAAANGSAGIEIAPGELDSYYGF